MTSSDNCRSRLSGRLFQFPLVMMMLMAAVVILAGCAAPAAVRAEPDISSLKLSDFSELKVPGSGHSALFTVVGYDVDFDKFAIVRIITGRMQNTLPVGERGESIKEDGIYAAVVREKQQDMLASMLAESGAKLTKRTALMFYDAAAEDFWITGAGDKGTVKYTDAAGVVHSLEIDRGVLGITFGISFERRLLGIPLTVSPQYQQRDALPKEYLQKYRGSGETDRMVLSQLSFTALMNIGDCLVICPDMVPLDDGSFSSYAFRGKTETTFRIYCIYCKNLTGI